MSRWILLLSFLLAACGERPPTVQECKALAAPKAAIDRCYGGKLAGKYVGDQKCWPFSAPRRLKGVWLIQFEESVFYPNAHSVQDVLDQKGTIWLKSELLERHAELMGTTRLYDVELDGRQALCDAGFGHAGMFPREVIPERFYSMRPIPLPR